MTNSRARGMQLIETYTSAGTAATKTFTFPQIDFTKVAYLLLEINVSTTATLNLEMKYNAIVTAYFDDGIETKAGTTTIINAGTAAQNVIVSTALLPAANAAVSGTVKIFKSKSGNQNYMQAISQFISGAEAVSHIGHNQATDFELTSIIIETSTSTWLANTTMTLWKVSR